MVWSAWRCTSRVWRTSTTWTGTACPRTGAALATAIFSTRRSASSRPSTSNWPDTEALARHFQDAEAECGRLLGAETPLPLPAYDQCMKVSHLFNLLDARGVISVTERQAYIGRVRNLARACCEAWVASRAAPTLAQAAK